MSTSNTPLGEQAVDVSMFADIPDPLGNARTLAPAGQDVAALHASAPRGPTRGKVRKQRALAIGAGVVWVVVVVMFLGARDHLTTVVSLCQIGIPTVLGLGALAFAVSRGRVGLGPTLPWTIALAVAPPIVFVVLGLALGAPSDTVVHHDGFQCGAVELLASLVSVVIAAVGVERSTVTNARWRGALLGSAIGLAWAGLWGIHCVDARASHVVLGHGYPVVLCAVLGAFVVSRVARVR